MQMVRIHAAADCRSLLFSSAAESCAEQELAIAVVEFYQQLGFQAEPEGIR